MNQTQTNYIKLKTLHKALMEEYHARTEPYWDGVDVDNMADEDIDRIVDPEVQIEADLGLHLVRAQLLDAERELAAWCHERVKAVPEYADKETDIVHLLENYRKHPSIRPKVIDLCLHLADE